MRRGHEVTIGATPDAVWRTWSDVEAWSDFIDTVHDVSLVGPRLGVGARVRLSQYRLPQDEWTVTALDEGSSWTWQSRSPGLVTIATHVVEPRTGGTSTLARVDLRQEGPVGSVIGRLLAPLLDRYLRSELIGLRRQCESG